MNFCRKTFGAANHKGAHVCLVESKGDIDEPKQATGLITGAGI